MDADYELNIDSVDQYRKKRSTFSKAVHASKPEFNPGTAFIVLSPIMTYSRVCVVYFFTTLMSLQITEEAGQTSVIGTHFDCH